MIISHRVSVWRRVPAYLREEIGVPRWTLWTMTGGLFVAFAANTGALVLMASGFLH